MIALSDRDNGRHVSVHVGDVLELRLGENASTGHRWAPDSFDSRILELVETRASYPGTAMGSGGEAIFEFRVVGAGSGTLALKCWRHWEGPGSIVQRFSATIEAAP